MSNSAAGGRSPLGLFLGQPRPRLYDRMVEALRSRRYSRRTEEAYLHWIRRFVAFHGGIHPRELAESDLSRFLTHLAIGENRSTVSRKRPPARAGLGRPAGRPKTGGSYWDTPELVVNTMVAGPARPATSSQADQDRFYPGPNKS